MSESARSDTRASNLLELPEVLDLRAAAPLASEFLARRGAELRVDASRVRKLGGQCLQVLLSAAMTWKADEIDLSIGDPSSEFLAGLAMLGIAASDLVEQDPQP